MKKGEPPPELRQPAPAGAPPNTQPVTPSDFYVVTQPVKIDVTEGSQLIVAGGLKPGDQIVIDGQERLRNGSRVVLPHAGQS